MIVFYIFDVVHCRKNYRFPDNHATRSSENLDFGFRRPSILMELKRWTCLLQKFCLFFRCFTPQYGVTVWITSEAIDDDFVFDFKIQCVFIGIAFKQRHGLFMDNLAFTVHQRHKHEMAFVRKEVSESGLANGFLGKDECSRVLGKCLGTVAEQVAWELVKDDDFGEPALQGIAPVWKFAASRLLPDIEKLSVNLCIEFIVSSKLERAVFFGKPEI